MCFLTVKVTVIYFKALCCILALLMYALCISEQEWQGDFKSSEWPQVKSKQENRNPSAASMRD